MTELDARAVRVAFTVAGEPIPQGSKTALERKGGGRPILVESMTTSGRKRLKEWRRSIERAAVDARHVANECDAAPWPTPDPVAVTIAFRFKRPKAHFGTGRNADTLKPWAPLHRTSKPDVDKLARAVLDALTGALYVDDSQVVDLAVSKWYATLAEPGATITVERVAT